MTSKALTVAKALTPEELTALLQETGFAEKSGTSVRRMKFENGMLTTPDGDMFVYNPAKPEIPAVTVRIVKMPDEYYGIWIDEDAARALGRPELAGKQSKKYIHPDENRTVWESDEAYDDLRRLGLKGSWKADIELQIIPPSGQLTGNEPVYTLTLPTTSLIEFKGASRSPAAGSVSEFNFIQKLAQFAQADAKDGEDTRAAVLNALTSLRLGGVVAQIRLLKAENKEARTTWTVISFDPLHIEPMTEQDMLVSGEVVDTDGVPF